MNGPTHRPFVSCMGDLKARHAALIRQAAHAPNGSVAQGWFERVDRLCAQLEAASPPLESVQVRFETKHGALRIGLDFDRKLVSGGTADAICDLAQACETGCQWICCDCGSTSERKLRRPDWYTTRCVACHAKFMDYQEP